MFCVKIEICRYDYTCIYTCINLYNMYVYILFLYIYFIKYI